jgi:uncharacterized UBP type Zn finger protein
MTESTGRPRKAETCEHMNQVKDDIAPRTPEGCEECLKMGDSWVHLRLCMVCGHVGCCNNSKNKHASKHFAETGHAIIRSFEPGESWMWCYEDELFIVPKKE